MNQLGQSPLWNSKESMVLPTIPLPSANQN